MRSVYEFPERSTKVDIETLHVSLSECVESLYLTISHNFPLIQWCFEKCMAEKLSLLYKLLSIDLGSLKTTLHHYYRIAERTISTIHTDDIRRFRDSFLQKTDDFYKNIGIGRVRSLQDAETMPEDICLLPADSPMPPESWGGIRDLIWECVSASNEIVCLFDKLVHLHSTRDEATCSQLFEMALERYREERFEHDWNNFQLSIEHDYLIVQPLSVKLLRSIKGVKVEQFRQTAIGSFWEDIRFSENPSQQLSMHEFSPEELNRLFRHLCQDQELTQWIMRQKIKEIENDNMFEAGVSNIMLSDHLSTWIRVNISKKSEWAAVYCVMKEEGLFKESFIGSRHRIQLFCERMNKLFDPPIPCDYDNIRKIISQHSKTSFLLWHRSDPLFLLARKLHEKLKLRSAYTLSGSEGQVPDPPSTPNP